MHRENEARRQDSHEVRAIKMRRYLETGHDESQAARVFCCKVSSVRAHLALLECSQSIRDAVRDGRMSLSAATKASRLSSEEQDALAESGDPGETIKVKEVDKIELAKRGKSCRPSVKEIRSMIVEMGDAIPDDAKVALEWVLTGKREGWIPDEVSDGPASD